MRRPYVEFKTTALFTALFVLSSAASAAQDSPRLKFGDLGNLQISNSEQGPGNAPTGATRRALTSDTPEFRALVKQFTRQYLSNTHDVAGNESFPITKIRFDEYGIASARIAQRINDLPVFGGQLIVNARSNGDVFSVAGEFASGRDVSKRAIVPALQSLTHVLDHEQIEQHRVTKTPVLGYLPVKNRVRLVWKSRVKLMKKGEFHITDFYINALNGKLIEREERLQHAAPIRTKDAKGIPFNKGNVVCRNNGACPTDTVQTLHDHVHTTRDYYLNTFKRDSLDGKGEPIRSTANIIQGDGGLFPFTGRVAAWTGDRMIFGAGDRGFNPVLKPFSDALEVVAHEFTHGVIQHEGAMRYRADSGALNEAWADVLGISAKIKAEGGYDDLTWHSGNALFVDEDEANGFRFLDNPTEDGISRDWWPNRYVGFNDSGGVHINSGIANLAFVLMVKGGKHPRLENDYVVPEIGVDRTSKIFYRALTNYMTPNSDFIDAALATHQAATDMFGSRVSNGVLSAWCAVGVPVCGQDATTLLPENITTLERDVTVRQISGKSYDNLYYQIDVPTGAKNLRIKTAKGIGDVDLFVKRKKLPGTLKNHCVSAGWTNVERCVIANPRPGRYFIIVSGAYTFDRVTLRVRWD